jgi:hypothetical protein
VAAVVVLGIRQTLVSTRTPNAISARRRGTKHLSVLQERNRPKKVLEKGNQNPHSKTNQLKARV